MKEAMIVYYEIRDRNGRRVTGTYFRQESLSRPTRINNTEGWSPLPKSGQIIDYQDFYSPEEAKQNGVENSSATVYQYFKIKDAAGCVFRIPTMFAITFGFSDGKQVSHNIVSFQEYAPSDF